MLTFHSIKSRFSAVLLPKEYALPSPLSRSLGIFGDFEKDFAFGNPQPSPQCHIQHHHHAEAHRKKHRADVGVLSLRHFWDQFLHHNIQHGSGKKVKGFAV